MDISTEKGTYTWGQGNLIYAMAKLYPQIIPETLSTSEVREKVISSGLLDNSKYGLGRTPSDNDISDFRRDWQIAHEKRIIHDENENISVRLIALNKFADCLYKRYRNVNRRNTEDINRIINKVKDTQFREAVLIKLVEIEFKEDDLHYTGLILKDEEYSDLHKTAREKIKTLETEETGLQKMKRKKASDPVEADGWLYFSMKDDVFGLYKSRTDGSEMQLIIKLSWNKVIIKEIDVKNRIIYFTAYNYYTYEKFTDIDVTETTTIEYKMTIEGKDLTEISRKVEDNGF